MSKVKEIVPTKLGRKRDPALDMQILEATLEKLAEVGFDIMSMDMVAAHIGSGKTTLYRRWPSKAELVKDALIWMSRNSIELDQLPDTGTLKGDLLALLKPYSEEYSNRKFRVFAGLGSFFTAHQKLAEEVTAAVFDPMTEVNRKIFQRAQERGELRAKADIEMACEIIVGMVSFRTLTLRKTFDKAYYSSLLDGVFLEGVLK